MVEAGFKTVDEVLVVDLVINGSKKERKKPEKFVGLTNFFSCSEICGVFFFVMQYQCISLQGQTLL